MPLSHFTHSAASEVTAQSVFDFRCIDSQRIGQIEQMVLFLGYYFAQDFSERELTQRISMPNPLSIIQNGYPFIFQVEPKHVFRLVEHFHIFRRSGGCAIEVIDLFGDEKSVT